MPSFPWLMHKRYSLSFLILVTPYLLLSLQVCCIINVPLHQLPTTDVQARVLLSYLHHYADTDKNGALCLEEVLAALAPFSTPSSGYQRMQEDLLEVSLLEALCLKLVHIRLQRCAHQE